jgi:hypothetical protein
LEIFSCTKNLESKFKILLEKLYFFKTIVFGSKDDFGNSFLFGTKFILAR